MRFATLCLLLLVVAAPAQAQTAVLPDRGGGNTSLRKVNPRTLKLFGPRYAYPRFIVGYETSPDARTLAVYGDDLRFVSRQTMRQRGKRVVLPGRVLSAAWLTDDTLLVVGQATATSEAAVYAIDPATRSVRSRFELEHSMTRTIRVGDGWAVDDVDYRGVAPPDPTVTHVFNANGSLRETVPGAFAGAVDDALIPADPAGDLLAGTSSSLAYGSAFVAERPGDVTIVDRATAARRTVPGDFHLYGYGSGYATWQERDDVRRPRTGVVGHDATGAVAWRALKGVQLATRGAHVGRYLYLTDTRGRTWSLNKRTGKVLGRLRFTGSAGMVTGPVNGNATHYIEDSDEFDPDR